MHSCFVISYLIICMANAICIVNNDDIYIHQFFDQINITNNTKIHLNLDSQNDTQCLSIKEIHYTFIISNDYSDTAYIDIIDSLCVGSCLVIKNIDSMTKNYEIDFGIWIPDTTIIFYNITIIYQVADDIPEPVSNEMSDGARVGIVLGSVYGGFILIAIIIVIVSCAGKKMEGKTQEETPTETCEEKIPENNNETIEIHSLDGSSRSNVSLTEVSNVPS